MVKKYNFGPFEIIRKPAKKYDLYKLGPVQLSRLRQDVVLCSLFISDYKNRYNINPAEVCEWFNGYTDYLQELMEEEHGENFDFYELLPEYDNKDNLYAWQLCHG